MGFSRTDRCQKCDTLMTNLSLGLDALSHWNVTNALPLDFGSVFSGGDPTHFCSATSVPPNATVIDNLKFMHTNNSS